MRLERSKVFRDNVHGYINVPEEFVSAFIDTDLFQRLRHIEQTGMRTLFPSARHDRFIHSLGVFHLGHKAFECFKKNVKISYPDTHYKVKEDKEENELFWQECQILFEIACLMHDCGHAPFSHTLEYVYDLEPMDSIPLRDKLKEYIGSNRFGEDYDGEGGPHEVMSALLVCSEYRNEIERILQNNAGTTAPLFNISEATEFIVRMIIGFEYKNVEGDAAHQMQNCMINLLNSKSIDVDSLDYIIRDSQMSGINNMSIDVDRLLQSLTIVEMTKFNQAPLRDREVNAIALEGILSSLDSQNAAFEGRFEGRTSLLGNGTSIILTEGAVSVSGDANIEKDCNIDSGEHLGKSVSIGGTAFESIHKTSSRGIIKIQGILKGELALEGGGLNFAHETNAQGRIQASQIHFTSTALNGRLRGTFTGTLLGNHTKLAQSHSSSYVKLGFHKSSLSVIQNVITARNYEYQWIYSHHKVVYYANYLEIELLRQCIRFILERNSQPLHATDEIQKMLSWKTMIFPSASEPDCKPYDLYGHKFWRPTDADIASFFNYCQIEAGENDKVSQFMHEYRTRHFKKSLWKSYAEMRNFFDGFTQKEINDLREMLVVYSSENEDDESLKGYRLSNQFGHQYGYPKKEFCDELFQYGLSDVVWVTGDSKLKELKPESTYIHFKDRDMTYGSVSSPNDIRPISKLDLFYIYYTPVPGKDINAEELKIFFRKSLQKWKKS